MKKLKVYGWIGYRSECNTRSHQTREIAASTSKLKIAKALGFNCASQVFNLTETENVGEIKLCLNNPGVIFWKGLDDYSGDVSRYVADKNVKIEL